MIVFIDKDYNVCNYILKEAIYVSFESIYFACFNIVADEHCTIKEVFYGFRERHF